MGPAYTDARMFKRALGAGALTAVSWRDDHRRTTRVARYRGDCIVCGRRTWTFDDGDNDPRGVLGDHALHVVYAEDDDHELRCCALCGNDYDAHKEALTLGRRAADITELAPLP